jgi:hypothetical protein
MKFQTPVMKKESLEKMTLSELCDLLAEHTLELLDSLEKRADGVTIRDQKQRVELIQEIILKKKSA